ASIMLYDRAFPILVFCFCCIFFFSFSLPHLHLHSFPTRRSSDLKRSIGRCRVSRCWRWLATSVSHWRAWRLTSSRSAKLRRGQKDRKSTRLNSSHQIISYAVFCLKKKRKQK